jgi:hypothetical protein
MSAVAKCPRCIARGKTWNGSDATCAFPNGRFVSANWNCATMNALRDATERLRAARGYTEDQNAALLPWDGHFILLGWYKSRGRTDVARVLDTTSRCLVLTLAKAERYLTGGTP